MGFLCDSPSIFVDHIVILGWLKMCFPTEKWRHIVSRRGGTFTSVMVLYTHKSCGLPNSKWVTAKTVSYKSWGNSQGTEKRHEKRVVVPGCQPSLSWGADPWGFGGSTYRHNNWGKFPHGDFKDFFPSSYCLTYSHMHTVKSIWRLSDFANGVQLVETIPISHPWWIN